VLLASGKRRRLDHTHEVDMNDLDTLWDYIKRHAPPGGIESSDGSPGKFRDLKQYHEKKLARWNSAGTKIQRRTEDLINDPLDVFDFLPGLKAGDSYGAYLGIEPG
jgi:hypothetical protein